MQLKNQQIETIVFDLGGVLMDIDYLSTSVLMSKIGLTDFDQIYTQHQQNDLFNAFETGQLSPFLFINKLLERSTNKGINANQLVHAWNAMIGNFRANLIDVVLQLRGKYKVALLSNTNAIHFELVKRNWEKAFSFNFESLFDGFFLSHEIGMRKPNADCFEYVLQQMNSLPKNVLFIDDSIQHIQGAKSLGINTCLFVDQNDLFQLCS